MSGWPWKRGDRLTADDLNAALAQSGVPVTKHGAKGNGQTDDGPAIQKAIDEARESGRAVYFPPGTYLTSQTIIIYAKTILFGDNPNTTIIKLADGAQVNLLETYRFADFTGTNIGLVSDPDFAWGFALRNLRFDGNRANNWGGIAPTKDLGYGIRLYGRRYIVENVYIQECAGIGFYSECSAGGGGPIPENNRAGYIAHVDVKNTSYEGFVFKGPPDIRIDDVVVGDVCPAGASGTAPAGASLLFPGKTIDGVVFDGGAVELGFLHSHSSKLGYCVRVNNCRLRAENLTGEGGIGCVLIEGSSSGQINKLNTRNNAYGPGGASTPADIRLAMGGNGMNIDNIEVNRGSNTLGGSAVEVAAPVQIGQIKVRGNSQEGHGVVFESGASESQIGQIWTTFLIGNAADGNPSRAVWTKSGVTGLILGQITSRSCDVGWYNESTGRILIGKAYLRVDPATFPSNVAAVTLSATPGLQQLRRADIETVTGGTIRNSQFSGEATLNATITTEQTASLTHNLWRQPDKAEVALSLYHTGTAPTVQYAYVSDVSATNVAIKVKFSAAGTGTAIALVKV